jgi:hypothetical protein
VITDININLSQWPFRRLPLDETPELVEKLHRNGITQAWAGSFDGVLHRDVAGVNSRLANECGLHGEGILIPSGSVNPMLPDWQDDVRRCHEQHGMRSIRINPNYHGYKLNDPICDELFQQVVTHKLIVQLVLKMEDVRTHFPLMMVPTVDMTPLSDLIQRHPDVRLILMNNYNTLRGETLSKAAQAENVYFDISHAEQVGALEKITKSVPYEKLLFGSHAPFFYLEAALLKFKESELGETITRAIQFKNAERLLNEP